MTEFEPVAAGDTREHAPETMPDSGVNETGSFRLWRILRMSTFHVGSAMGDILTAGVWNRILISDFGIPAWPVGLLIALKNFMAPISLWVGHRSDTKAMLGWHRTSYIWSGRALMLASFLLLGFSTIRLERDPGEFLGWFTAVVTFLLYGAGTLISGSPYLALVRDSAPPQKQGMAIALVETVLIGMFPLVALGFSRMLITYDQSAFWQLLLFVFAISGFFWIFSVAGVESRNRRLGQVIRQEGRVALQDTFRLIWGDGRTRRFFVFLFVATFAAWMQDNILEPFAADVFDFAVNETTRLTSYWGTATIVVLLSSFVIWRKKPPEELSGVARVGLMVMALGMAAIAASNTGNRSTMFLMALVVFGAGFGLYSFGGLSLMAVMSPAPDSGAYLGLWTVAILVSKGLGTFMGGVIRDAGLSARLGDSSAYAIVFAVSATGLLAAAVLIGSIDFVTFSREHRTADSQQRSFAPIDL